MTYNQKITFLQRVIEKIIDPLIGKKVIIPDAPYYANVGDVLIWQATLDFLKKTNRVLLSVSSQDTFSYPKLDKDITILLMGGGNFGDLWRFLQELRINIIDHYPHNRIVMLPQSIWYDDPALISKDSDIFSKHKDLHLCARDRVSYEFLKKHFNNNHLYLVPDMAFFLSESHLKRYRNADNTNRNLFLLRRDKELNERIVDFECRANKITDWPSLEKRPFIIKLYVKIREILKPYNHSKWKNKILDFTAQICFRRKLTRDGCKLLSRYSHITSTRLHGMILAILLHKPVRYIDNTTGKLSAFVNTWLDGLPDIESLERKTKTKSR